MGRGHCGRLCLVCHWLLKVSGVNSRCCAFLKGCCCAVGRQVVVPKFLREAVLGACHGGEGSGHFCSSKTLCRLRRGFYWGQHWRDVKTSADAAMTAQPTRGRLKSPMRRCSSSRLGHRWRRWGWTYWVHPPNADVLIEGMFSRFGAPDVIHSDQGRNFESRLFAVLCEG